MEERVILSRRYYPAAWFSSTYRLQPLRGARRRSSSDNPCRPRQANSHARIIKVVIAASLNGRRAIVRNIVWNNKTLPRQSSHKSVKFFSISMSILNWHHIFQLFIANIKSKSQVEQVWFLICKSGGLCFNGRQMSNIHVIYKYIGYPMLCKR